jgi:hypothetical protein
MNPIVTHNDATNKKLFSIFKPVTKRKRQTTSVSTSDCHIVSPAIPDNFVTNILLPKHVNDINVPVPIVTVPDFDVSKTIITRIFNNKIFKLYKGRSVDNIVVNLSHKVLSDSEKELLSKGLTFCPTEKEPDFGQLWVDLKLFFRDLE